MNEKIKQLAEQAGITDNNLSDGDMSRTDLEKFAELIVREVIAVYNHDGFQTPWEQDQLVLEHFGVEE